MKPNLGALDRILRFALAFWWLGPWALRPDAALARVAITLVGWIALAESFLGWCYLQRLLGIPGSDGEGKCHGA